MFGSRHSLITKDVFTCLFSWMRTPEFKNINLVCHAWYDLINTIKRIPAKNTLMHEFSLAEKTVDSLMFPDVVCKRLSRIFSRRKMPFSNEITLFQLYCSSGGIDENFLHLLDHDIAWFKKYFKKRDVFFIEYHFLHACMIGNMALAEYIATVVRSEFSFNEHCYALAAARSGSLALVKYLLLIEHAAPSLLDHYADFSKIYGEAILSGNLALLTYLKGDRVFKPDHIHFTEAVNSGSLEMVKFLHLNHDLTAESITTTELVNSNSLEVIHYLAEIMNWVPEEGRMNISAQEETRNAFISGGFLEGATYKNLDFPSTIKTVC